MRSKPDLSKFEGLKDADSFLHAGAADVAERKQAKPNAVQAAQGRVQKIFNCSPQLAARLRQAAMDRSAKTGVKVTEKDLIVAGLEAYLDRLDGEE